MLLLKSWTHDVDMLLHEITINALIRDWNTTRSGVSLVHNNMYRMCAIEHFLDGKLRRWEFKDESRKEKLQQTAIYARGYPCIDLYVGAKQYETNNINLGTAYFAWPPGFCVPYEYIWPSNRAEVGNHTMNFPAQPLQILDDLYGSDRRVPDPKSKAHSPLKTFPSRVLCKHKKIAFGY